MELQKIFSPFFNEIVRFLVILRNKYAIKLSLTKFI